ncbi:MAG: hypothetical protein K6G47_09980 [Clostridia bacterium]|nr:hypothetical protein [Clostridia bacterium]
MKEATTKRFKILVIILYFAVFAMNLAFVINWEDVFLPDSVTLVTTGTFPNCIGESNKFSIYQLGSNYYITLDETVKITYEEYKYCLSSYGELKDEYDNFEPDDSDPKSTTVIRNFFYRKEYPYISDSLRWRMEHVYRFKSPGKLYESVGHIFDEYGVKGANVYIDDGKEFYYQNGFRLYEPSYPVFCATVGIAGYFPEKKYDKRLDTINRKAVAEVSNVRLWQDGKIPIPFPFDNTVIIELSTEMLTGMTSKEYANAEYADEYSSVGHCFYLGYSNNKKTLNDRSKIYYRLRYMDIVLKGKEVIYFRTFSDEDLTILYYSNPSADEHGYLAFETRDKLTRQLLIWNLKLAIITDGRIPVISGSFLTIHVLFIAFVQNLILAVALLIGTKIRQKIVRRQVCH